MPLNAEQAVAQARRLYDIHLAEREQLDTVRRYWKGRQALPAVIPAAAPNEVRVMARSSRVNVQPIVVNSLVQSAFVDAYYGNETEDDKRLWQVWQANKMDAKQTGLHRATAGYGTGYTVVLPGDPWPVIHRRSPRSLCALYGEDEDWPMWALERLGDGLYRLFDDEAVYYVTLDQNQVEADGRRKAEFIETREHGLGVCPVVRYLNEDDLDADDEVDLAQQSLNDEDTLAKGEVAPLMPLQDQIDLTTFGLQIAQHYGAFKQRYIIGWVADSETERVRTSASTLMTLDRDPEDVKLGEFSQTDLTGYIKSREASLRHAATLSQTPVHELIGELVNLSAEALAAAEAGKDRKVHERQTLWGESHEQTFWLVGQIIGADVPESAEVHWEDHTARSFAATVDALGKLATMLEVPVEELWGRIPGATQQDVERYATARKNAPRPQVKPAIPQMPVTT